MLQLWLGICLMLLPMMYTEDAETVKSNLDNTVSVESKVEDATSDFSRTREFPEVLSNKMLDIDNHEVFCPSTVQDIEIDDSSFNEDDIHITREDPKVIFEKDSKKDDEDIFVMRNTENIPDAFIFCPNLGTNKMDKI